jgi:hypothetical protein
VIGQLEFPGRATMSRGGEKTRPLPPALDWVWAKDSLADSGAHQVPARFLDSVRTRSAPLTSGEDAFLTRDLVDRTYRACSLPPLAGPVLQRPPLTPANGVDLTFV